MSVSKCCISGFAWSGTPTGRNGKLANNDAYIAGDNTDVAISSADIPQRPTPRRPLRARNRRHCLCFAARNGREQREGKISGTARALKRDLGFKKVGAVGYCFGGWAPFRLGAKEHAEHEQPLID
ncbi:hypothetical protein BDW66DRAFT_152121 [Aspergillus desertorum]